MKKIFLPIILLCLLSIIFAPSLVSAQTTGGGGLVKCGTGDTPTPCTLTDFTTMVGAISTFIVDNIATPLAIIAIIIGGILWMMSAGNPKMMGLGKTIFLSAVIGLVLVFATKAIINFVLDMIGYSGTKLT